MATQRSPRERTLDTELFGRDVTFDYSETWVGYAVLGLRLVMAWVFLQAGLEKLLEGGLGDPLAWSSTDFLENRIADANPLQDLFLWFAEFGAIVDPLVIFGQILVGLALLLGVLVRFAAFWGVVMMTMFWTAAWQDGLTAGLPVENGYVINSSFVYLLLLFGLAAVGAGRILGFDARLEQTDVVQQNPSLKYLLG